MFGIGGSELSGLVKDDPSHSEFSPRTEFTANELAKNIADEPERLAVRLGPVIAERVFPEIDGEVAEHHVFSGGSVLTPTTKTFYNSTFALPEKSREILTTKTIDLQGRVGSNSSDALSVRLVLDEDKAEQSRVGHGAAGTITVDEEDVLHGGVSAVSIGEDSMVGRVSKYGRAQSKERTPAGRWAENQAMRPGGKIPKKAPGGPADARTYSGIQALQLDIYNRTDGRLTVPLTTEIMTSPTQIFLENGGMDTSRSLLEIYLRQINPALTSFVKRETDGQRGGYIGPDQTLRGGRFFGDFDVVVLSPGLVVLKDRQNPVGPESVVVLAQKPKSNDSWWHVARFQLTDDEKGGDEINRWLLNIEGEPADQ